MSEIKISFCIPTYNRCDFLYDLIENIIAQCEDRNDVEICISDNCSDDGTREMVTSWMEKTRTPIIYKSNEKNLGPDKNYLASVALASGEYCWLFGSDDKLSDNAINLIDSYLMNDSDIYIVDRLDCDINMKPLNYSPWMITQDKLYYMNDSSELIEYFKNSQSIGAIFSYLSSIIFKKIKWNQVVYTDKFIGTAYSHVYYLLNILQQSSKIQYVNKPLVLCRGGNDHFLKDGIVKRILLDFDGYFLLADHLWSDDLKIKESFLSILLSERPLMRTCLIVTEHGNDEQKREIKKYYMKLGINRWLIDFYYSLRMLYIQVKKVKNMVYGRV